MGGYKVFGSIVGSEYNISPPIFYLFFTGDHSNQNQILRVSMGGYMVFGSVMVTDYYSRYYYTPPVIAGARSK